MDNMLTQWLPTAITVSASAIILYLTKNYLPKYFDEKGKNLATKEDIAEITFLVEDVKNSFTIQTESLKANLQLLNNVKTSISLEERNAVVDFHVKYFRWFSLLTGSSLSEINTYKDEDLNNYIKKISEGYIQVQDSSTKFDLFVNDDELLNVANDLKIKTLETFTAPISDLLFGLITSNGEMNEIQTTEPIEQRSTKQKPVFGARMQKHANFNTESNQRIRDIAPLIKNFRDLSKTFIYKLLKTD